MCILENPQPRQDVAEDVLSVGKALQEVTEDNRKLKEELNACKTAHERDVASLERMLEQVMAENKRLTSALYKVDYGSALIDNSIANELHKGDMISQSKVLSKEMQVLTKNMPAGAKQRAMSPPTSLITMDTSTSGDSESATSSDFDKQQGTEDAFASFFAAAAPYFAKLERLSASP